jgi:hypothetical protein
MLSRLGILGLVAISVLAYGCNKSPDSNTGPATPETASNSAQSAGPNVSQDPKVVVTSFLEAIRKGDNEAAGKFLTKVARQKAEETGRCVAPPANDHAKVEVDEATYPTPEHNIAHVPNRWIDLDASGSPRTEKAVWVCRLEPEGWRVAGLAAYVFDGEDPLLLNFENPEEMAKKQKWLTDEIIRREKVETKAPQAGENALQAAKKPQDAFQR